MSMWLYLFDGTITHYTTGSKLNLSIEMWGIL